MQPALCSIAPNTTSRILKSSLTLIGEVCGEEEAVSNASSAETPRLNSQISPLELMTRSLRPFQLSRLRLLGVEKWC